MTGPELAALPIGTIIELDNGDKGEIIQTGTQVQVCWEGGPPTTMSTTSIVWQEFIRDLKVEEL